jgi:hypothetical protein
VKPVRHMAFRMGGFQNFATQRAYCGVTRQENEPRFMLARRYVSCKACLDKLEHVIQLRIAKSKAKEIRP